MIKAKTLVVAAAFTSLLLTGCETKTAAEPDGKAADSALVELREAKGNVASCFDEKRSELCVEVISQIIDSSPGAVQDASGETFAIWSEVAREALEGLRTHPGDVCEVGGESASGEGFEGPCDELSALIDELQPPRGNGDLPHASGGLHPTEGERAGVQAKKFLNVVKRVGKVFIKALKLRKP